MAITSHKLRETEPVLHYLSHGEAEDKPTLIFLHGVTSHAHYWDDIASAFAADYAVYALDWRGHGDSAHDADYNQLEYYLDDLRRLVAALAPTNLTLVGHSLGGFVALGYAAEAPTSLVKVVVCDIKPSLNDEERESLLRSASKPAPRFASLDELTTRFVAILHDNSADPALLARLARQGARPNEDGTYSFKYDRQALAFPPPESWRYAPQITLPVLVINGAQSHMVPGEAAAHLAASLPNGQHSEIAQAGHHVFLDQPAEFIQVVRNFLAS